MNLILKPFIIVIYSLSVIFCQDNLDNLIHKVLSGEVEDAIMFLPQVENDYPNNPSVLFLKGLLEKDGDKAMELFSMLYNDYPSSEYSDDAIMKVAEYYYAEGLYVQCSNWLKKIPIYYSRSEHVERSIKLFLNSLIVSGHKDTAIFYSRVFERQFPDLDFNTKINELLLKFEEKNRQSMLEETSLEDSVVDSEKKKKNYLLNIFDNKKIQGLFSLQAGAYSLKNNAESQKLDLLLKGYQARIEKLYRKDKTLFTVRIGYFDTKNEAVSESNKIKSQLNIDTIVITNNK